MFRTLSIVGLTALSLAWSAHAQVEATPDEDELVRLPGQGEVREPTLRDRTKAKRLKPGAGLFLTFDADENGKLCCKSAFDNYRKRRRGEVAKRCAD